MYTVQYICGREERKSENTIVNYIAMLIEYPFNPLSTPPRFRKRSRR